MAGLLKVKYTNVHCDSLTDGDRLDYFLFVTKNISPFFSVVHFLDEDHTLKKHLLFEDDRINFLSIPVHEITYILMDNTGLGVFNYLITSI